MTTTAHDDHLRPPSWWKTVMRVLGVFFSGFVMSCALVSLFVLFFILTQLLGQAGYGVHNCPNPASISKKVAENLPAACKGKAGIVVDTEGVVTRDFILKNPEEGMHKGGIFPTLFGTAAVTLFMLLFALPLGVGAAVFWVEYIREGRMYRLIESAVNNLAGVPSIVYGLFGLGFFVLFIGGMMDKVAGNKDPIFGQPALIWAAMTLSVLVLPVVMAATEEALKTVPKSHRAAALALGATRWQTVRRVVLPQAMPGILTGAILSVARGAGETAPILFTGAAYFMPDLPLKPLFTIGDYSVPFPDLFSQFMEMAYHIYIMATQSSNPEQTLPIQAGTTLVLLASVLVLNTGAIVLRYKLRKGAAQ